MTAAGRYDGHSLSCSAARPHRGVQIHFWATCLRNKDIFPSLQRMTRSPPSGWLQYINPTLLHVSKPMFGQKLGVVRPSICIERKASNPGTLPPPWGENQELAKHQHSPKRTEFLLVTISQCVISTATSYFILQKLTSCLDAQSFYSQFNQEIIVKIIISYRIVSYHI